MTNQKVTTRKLLVRYDPVKPRTRSGDFVVPIHDGAAVTLIGLDSGKRCQQGKMVFLGEDITMNDVFAKLVDSGQKIESVERTLKMLEHYLQSLQDFKIGNIIGIEPSSDEPCGFRLKKVAERPPTEKTPLP